MCTHFQASGLHQWFLQYVNTSYLTFHVQLKIVCYLFSIPNDFAYCSLYRLLARVYKGFLRNSIWSLLTTFYNLPDPKPMN